MSNDYFSSIRPFVMFGHVQTNERFISTLETLGQNFGQSIPQSSHDKREMEGIYHFFNSKRVMPTYILLNERERLKADICEACPPVVLSIGDVTVLDYAGKRCASKTNFVTTAKKPGYNVLSQLFCDGQGVPLGLFDQFLWNYEAKDLGKRAERQHLSIEHKETAHYFRQWQSLNDAFGGQPETCFIHLFDRAGDVHELLQTQVHPHIHYIIRAKNDRKLHDQDVFVSDWLDGQQPSGGYEFRVNKQSPKKQTFIEIKRKNGAKTENRVATIEVTFATTTLTASNASKNRPIKPFQVGIVRAKEVNPPPGCQAVEWTLYTTLPLNSFEDAMKVIGFYALRWQIENFHYTLKQGAKVEELQLEDPKAIQNAIATYSLLAVQVSRLRYLAEKQPQASIEDAGFTQQDYFILALFLNSKNALAIDPAQPNTTIGEFAALISMLGGNHNRKKVGIQSIWLGLQRFETIKHAFTAFASG